MYCFFSRDFREAVTEPPPRSLTEIWPELAFSRVRMTCCLGARLASFSRVSGSGKFSRMTTFWVFSEWASWRTDSGRRARMTCSMGLP